jgi:hypothetical protein
MIFPNLYEQKMVNISKGAMTLDTVSDDAGVIEKVRLSQILDRVLDAKKGQDKISLKDMIDVLGVRAYGSLLLLFSIPNAVPSIPGLMAVLGAPLVLLSIQMMLGMTPWLPDFLSRQGVSYKSVETLRNRVRPALLRADKVVRHRWLWLTKPGFERILGAFIFVLSLSVLTPIPFTNLLPAWAICIMSIGVLERDGIWIVFGVAFGIFALFVTVGVLGALASTVLGAFI